MATKRKRMDALVQTRMSWMPGGTVAESFRATSFVAGAKSKLPWVGHFS
jgi:hypothetical protein